MNRQFSPLHKTIFCFLRREVDFIVINALNTKVGQQKEIEKKISTYVYIHT